MQRKSKGSILVVTVFVFLLVNIIAISSSELILSNIKYTKYDYEEVFMEEQCLSKIELVYSKVLEKVNDGINESSDFEDFQEYITSNEFLNDIKNIEDEDLKNTTYTVKKQEVNSTDNGGISYKITSQTKYGRFSRYTIAYINIKNPFQMEKLDENQKIDENIDELNIENEDLKIESKAENDLETEKNTNQNENLSTQEDLSVQNGDISQENETDNTNQKIYLGEIVTMFNCKDNYSMKEYEQ